MNRIPIGIIYGGRKMEYLIIFLSFAALATIFGFMYKDRIDSKKLDNMEKAIKYEMRAGRLSRSEIDRMVSEYGILVHKTFLKGYDEKEKKSESSVEAETEVNLIYQMGV